MANNLEYIYTLLNEVLPNKVYYAVSVKDNIELPIIVYQELNKRGKTYADDAYLLKELTIQLNLITSNKNIELEKRLEDKLKSYDIDFQMITEFYLADSGLYRIYEIKMEEYKNEQ